MTRFLVFACHLVWIQIANIYLNTNAGLTEKNEIIALKKRVKYLMDEFQDLDNILNKTTQILSTEYEFERNTDCIHPWIRLNGMCFREIESVKRSVCVDDCMRIKGSVIWYTNQIEQEKINKFYHEVMHMFPFWYHTGLIRHTIHSEYFFSGSPVPFVKYRGFGIYGMGVNAEYCIADSGSLKFWSTDSNEITAACLCRKY